jgi:hypothetical protein
MSFARGPRLPNRPRDFLCKLQTSNSPGHSRAKSIPTFAFVAATFSDKAASPATKPIAAAHPSRSPAHGAARRPFRFQIQTLRIMNQRYNPLSADDPGQAPEIRTAPKRNPAPEKKFKSKSKRAKKPRAATTPQEALSRAMAGISLANYPAIIEGFIARGIPADDIKPRENVFTFNAWIALGRVVRRGEKSLKILTWIVRDGKETIDPSTGELTITNGKKFPKTAYVFHISQTDPLSRKTDQPKPAIQFTATPPISIPIQSAPRPVTNWRARIHGTP